MISRFEMRMRSIRAKAREAHRALRVKELECERRALEIKLEEDKAWLMRMSVWLSRTTIKMVEALYARRAQRIEAITKELEKLNGLR